MAEAMTNCVYERLAIASPMQRFHANPFMIRYQHRSDVVRAVLCGAALFIALGIVYPGPTILAEQPARKAPHERSLRSTKDRPQVPLDDRPMRMRVETPEGVLVIFDAAAPPDGDEGCWGFLAYWRSSLDQSKYVFPDILEELDDLTAPLLALQRDLGVDLEALADADDRIAEVQNTTAQSSVEDLAWEPATIRRAVEIMGFDSGRFAGLDDPLDDVTAQEQCFDCNAAGVGAPSDCGSAELLAREAWAVASICCPTCDGSNPCCGVTCPQSTVCVQSGCSGGYCYEQFLSGNSCYSDQNPCTYDVCNGGICQHPNKPNGTACPDDGNPCTNDACYFGNCYHPTKPNYAPCTDNNECTINDVCYDGNCYGGPPPDCDDGNVCTFDSCNAATGCTHTNNPDACDDGLFCNGAETCGAQGCQAGEDPCPDSLCDEEHDACVECIDGSDCDDGNPCTEDSCWGWTGATAGWGGVAKGKCVNEPSSDPCCGSSDPCCNPDNPCCLNPCSCMNCDDGNPCTDDGCTAGSCWHEPKCDVGMVCCNGVCCQNTLQGFCCSADPAPLCCNNACCEGVCINDTECCPGKACPAPPGAPVPEICCDECDTCTSIGCCSGTVCPDDSCCADGTPCTQDVCVCTDPPLCTAYSCEFPPVCNDGNSCTEDVCTVGDCDESTCSFPNSQNCAECPGGRCIDGTCIMVVDLHFEGVADDQEEDPGAFVSTWDEEGELLPGLTLKAGPGLTGTVTFQVSGHKGGIQLWQDAQGTSVLPLFNQTLLVSELPKTLYVTGYVVSPAPRDIEFRLTYNGPDIGCEDIVKLTVVELKLKSLTFTTDHDLIRNNVSDFEPTGNVFPEPKWEAGRTPYEDFPISHTLAQNVGIDAHFELLPFGSYPPDFALSTEGPQGFHFNQDIWLPGGESVFSLTSDDQLEERIQKIVAPVQWTVKHNGRVFLRKTAGPYHTFVTMGTPRDTTAPQHVVTWNRMNRAVQFASIADSINPHAIVQELVWAVGPYDLGVGELPSAWLVPERGGDCQLIVRFGIKVAKMIDLPGEYEHTNIYAIETAPTVAIEGSPYDGLGSPDRSHPTQPWTLRLIDGGGDCNDFEACIKFTCSDQPRYFPGGTYGAVLDNKDGVLGVFDSLSWISGSCVLEQIIHLYSGPNYTPVPPPCP